MLGAFACGDRLHTTLASVVVTAPGVSVGLGRETGPLISGMVKSGNWTPVRSGPPVAWPGTTGGCGAAAAGGAGPPQPQMASTKQAASAAPAGTVRPGLPGTRGLVFMAGRGYERSSPHAATAGRRARTERR